jgi:hypothetical protein
MYGMQVNSLLVQSQLTDNQVLFLFHSLHRTHGG